MFLLFLLFSVYHLLLHRLVLLLYNYHIFSIYKVAAEDYYIQTDFNDETYIDFLNTIKKRSINNFNIELNKDSKILTLSTCTDGNKYRLVVHAVLQND